MTGTAEKAGTDQAVAAGTATERTVAAGTDERPSGQEDAAVRSGCESRAPRVCVVSGSPRVGASASRAFARACADSMADCGADVHFVDLSRTVVAPCIGCGACSVTGRCVMPDSLRAVPGAVPAWSDDESERSDACLDGFPRAGFASVAADLLGAGALVLVTPVYFAGPPSQLKALLDRLQVFWAQRYALGLESRALVPKELRKPLGLVVFGDGGDPFGYEPLVASVSSALRMVDYRLVGVHDCVGPNRPASPRDAGGEYGREFLRGAGLLA